jgi:cytochrome P450
MQKLKANAGSENSTSATIFDTILNPKANKNRPVPSDDSLTAESILMFLAGTDTTANALVLGTYEMLRQPTIKQKLRDELQCALILGSEKTTTTDLRGLPYLVDHSKKSP